MAVVGRVKFLSVVIVFLFYGFECRCFGVSHSRRHMREGEILSIGKRFLDVAKSGGQVSVVLENNCGCDIFVADINVRSSFQGRIEKGFNPSVDTDASNLSLVNKRSDGVHSGSFDVFSAGDGQPGAVTLDGTNFNNKHLPAGKNTGPGTTAHLEGNVVADGDFLVVRVVNESGSSGDVSIDVDFVDDTA